MLRRSLMATEYHELQERAEDVQLLLKQMDPNATPEFLHQKFEEIYQIKDDGKYLQVLDQDGNWLYRSKRMIDEGLRPAVPGDLRRKERSLNFIRARDTSWRWRTRSTPMDMPILSKRASP